MASTLQKLNRLHLIHKFILQKGEDEQLNKLDYVILKCF